MKKLVLIIEIKATGARKTTETFSPQTYTY